jgi:hypothetical protein
VAVPATFPASHLLPRTIPGKQARKKFRLYWIYLLRFQSQTISGYHMAVVAGVVFFVFRAGLALIPGIALRHPIKKWGALAALLAATFYLVLSGAEVATQRSFIMIST